MTAVVIDASVMLGIRGKLAADPTLPRVRSFLAAIRKSSLVSTGVALTFDEWRNASRNDPYLAEWRQLMASERRLVTLKGVDRRDLADVVTSSNMSPDERERVIKDLHLVEGAIASDRRVASADDKMRATLRKWSDLLPESHRIVWVNPEDQSENATRWVDDGAPDDIARRLVPTCTRPCCAHTT